MKTWEVYKMLDEWNIDTKSPVVINKANGLEYEFVFDGDKKGIKLLDERYKGKTQYHFSVNGEWEYKYSFNTGDLVVNTISNKVHKIKEKLTKGQYLSEDNTTLHENNLRSANKEDIKWGNIGRRVNQYKPYDIVKVIKTKEIYEVHDTSYPYDLELSSDDYETHVIVSRDMVEMICPVENRLDKF